jgi:hypothetical protein
VACSAVHRGGAARDGAAAPLGALRVVRVGLRRGTAAGVPSWRRRRTHAWQERVSWHSRTRGRSEGQLPSAHAGRPHAAACAARTAPHTTAGECVRLLRRCLEGRQGPCDMQRGILACAVRRTRTSRGTHRTGCTCCTCCTCCVEYAHVHRHHVCRYDTPCGHHHVCRYDTPCVHHVRPRSTAVTCACRQSRDAAHHSRQTSGPSQHSPPHSARPHPAPAPPPAPPSSPPHVTRRLWGGRVAATRPPSGPRQPAGPSCLAAPACACSTRVRPAPASPTSPPVPRPHVPRPAAAPRVAAAAASALSMPHPATAAAHTPPTGDEAASASAEPARVRPCRGQGG